MKTINGGRSMPGPKNVRAHPVLETLSFRGVPPSEEVLRLARGLAEDLRALLDADAGCELSLASVRWLWSESPTVEARVTATCLGAPVAVYEEAPTPAEAVRVAFDALGKVVRGIHDDERPGAAAPRPALAVT